MAEKKQKRILIIDNDRFSTNTLKNELKEKGFNAIVVTSCQEGIDYCIKDIIDLVLLELNLPDHDGLFFIESLRSFNNIIPIIVVSKRAGIDDKILALNAGANDYLVKPYYFLELLARINKEFRYRKSEEEHLLINGPLTIDYGGKLIFVNGKEIHLTNFEYKILLILATNLGKVVSYNELISSVWGNNGQDQNGLRVFLAGIRRKIEKDKNAKKLIETAVGMGYKMNIIKDENGTK